MRALDLKNKKIVIWGTGREGHAAARFVREFLPRHPMTFVDEAAESDAADKLVDQDTAVKYGADIVAALDDADAIIKSPGVSLYHPLLQKQIARGAAVTSLHNMWFAEPRTAKTICVTGTKGKSTTSSLIAHMLTKLGKTCALAGNIGVPITEVAAGDYGFIVIEVSSYQAANFDGLCDIGVLTSLYPEHLDWHKSLDAYYADKLNLLRHALIKVINDEASGLMQQHKLKFDDAVLFNASAVFHANDGKIYDGTSVFGAVRNAHLSRTHNLVNICAALTVMRQLGLDPQAALATVEDFEGLPHRQYELGLRDGILYVDDSISTTPQSAIAAMNVYVGKPITLIVGGYDRGIDYAPLVTYLAEHKPQAVICMGPSGERIFPALKAILNDKTFNATTMRDVVALARQHTPKGGVILLSPAAPSYGLFKNFVERGQAFAAEAGFQAASPTPK